MPLAGNSRYRTLPIFTALDAGGESHATVAIRLVARPARGPATFRHIVKAGETMEYLAWRYYGLSEAWWHIADANPGLSPFDLEPGAAIIIPEAGVVGRVVRDRRF
jgi:nucleoid-associated protein YgaU